MRVHASGHLTARERVAALLDPGSAVEFGVLQGRNEAGWVHTLGGVDFIGTVAGRPVITSSTDYSDRGGGYGAGYLARLFALSRQERWPVVLFVDGGGSRAQSLEPGARMDRLQGRYPGGTGFFEGLAALAGWVPLVAVVSGPSFAGHATLAAFCDVIITTRGSSIGMGGPPMVEAAFGIKLTPTELAPVEMHEETGGIDLLLDSEDECIAAAKRFLSYYYDEPSGPPPASAEGVRAIVPDADGPYDMTDVIRALVDEGSFFELRPNFARSLITAFARLDGRSIGVLANQPASPNGGAIDANAADKIARFVQLCDSYGLPLLSLMDTPGFTIRLPDGTEQPGMTRHHSRPVRALHHRSVPLFSVQVRKARGLAAAAMSGIGTARSLPLLRLAWPTVELGVADRYSQGFDDVIDPAETRGRLLAILRLLPRVVPAGKSRPRDSW